jgi:hypothetical protein
MMNKKPSTTLANLKQRLEALPSLREKAKQGDRFARFLVKTQSARRVVEQALNSSHLAEQTLPADYGKVATQARKAARRAGRLQVKIQADAAAVSAPSVEESFASLGSEADTTLRLCRETWERSITGKVQGRDALAQVLEKVLPAKGRELRDLVQKLQSASKNPPATESDAQRICSSLTRFDEIMSSLHLEGTVGDFLQALTAENGLALESLRNPVVVKFLDDNKLWPAIRVRLA